MSIIRGMRRKGSRTLAGADVDEAPHVIGPSRAEVRAAIETLPEDLGWDQMAARLRPMFVRRRPMPPGAERPLIFSVPVGVKVALGVDIGPAFLYVGPNVLEKWPVSADEALQAGYV